VSSFDRQQLVNGKSPVSAARPVPAAVKHRVIGPLALRQSPQNITGLGRGVSPSRVPLIDAVADAVHPDVLSSDEDDGTGGESVDEISRIG
jgi:hypothetical protein